MTFERRGSERMELTMPVTCTCYFRESEAGGMLLQSVTSNISDTGLCFVTGADLRNCRKVEIKGTGFPKTGRVVWSRLSAETGVYQVGVSLRHEDLEFAGLQEGPKEPAYPAG